MYKEDDIRARMQSEWSTISGVAGTLLFLSYSPFQNPPSAIVAGGPTVLSAYGILLGMTLSCAFTAVLVCMFFNLFLNSVEKGAAGAFVATFAHVLPIPILNLIAALLLLAGSICLVALQEYVGNQGTNGQSSGYFIIAFIIFTFVFLSLGSLWMFVKVHLQKSLRRHTLYVGEHTAVRVWPGAATGRAESVDNPLTATSRD